MSSTNPFEYVGHPDQLISFREGILTDGFSDNTKFMEVHNGSQLSATILPGRCMGIYQVRYKGVNMNYLTPAGIVAPQYYDNYEANWMRTFFAGMLSTMGLEHIGDPITLPSGQRIGLHGRIDCTPAENISYLRDVVDNTCTLKVSGTMRQAAMCEENLTLKRDYGFVYGQDVIEITDTITNHAFHPYQVLYGLHLNFGYPFLNETTRIILDSKEVISKDEWSLSHVDSWNRIEPPADSYPYRVYTHKVATDAEGQSHYTVYNDELNIGVSVDYDGLKYPFLGEWKNLAKGEYVLSLEPMNTDITGPKRNSPDCKAPVIGPGESITYHCRLNFIDHVD